MAIRVRSVLLGLLAIVALLVAGALTAVGWQVILGPDARPTSSEPFEVTPERLARGRYLVEGPTHCFHCHTEHDLSQPELPIVRSKRGAGWVLPVPELNNPAAPNITSDPDTGIGAWSDDEVARAIREGVRRDGTALFPMMPYMEFASMTDEDVQSVVVYLRTIPAVKNTTPARNLPFPLEYIVKTMPKPLPADRPVPARTTPVERGEYLVTLSGCAGCHSPAVEGVPMPGLTLAGGEPFPDVTRPGTTLHSMNLTFDPSGIAHYDEAFFISTIRSGRMGGRVLSHIMPFEFYRTMTDDDLRDIFAFLKSRPHVQHRVNNTDPPTPCPVCNRSHGLGDRNRGQ